MLEWFGSSALDPLKTFAIIPRASPLSRLGIYTGGCSASVPSSSLEPTYITVSQDCSLEDGSVEVQELVPEPGIILTSLFLVSSEDPEPDPPPGAKRG